MRYFFLTIGVVALTLSARASWYWPFGSDNAEADVPRLSELMEPATELIDEASDLAADGKVQESVEKYRAALLELDRIEAENPDRAQAQEFATVRNKRAYVNAAIDAMLLRQVKQNAKAVAVSDTTELERKLAAERAARSGKPVPAAEPKAEEQPAKVADQKDAAKPEKPADAKKPEEPRPAAGKDRVVYDIAHGDYEAAKVSIGEMLVAKPNDPVALNLKAAMEVSQGKLKDAESTLDQAIMSNPRNHYAYYNMALLVLRMNPENLKVAKRYYETGRAVGGPEDAELEELVK